MQRILRTALLYTRSDLRAQGLLGQGLLSIGILLFFGTIALIAIYRFTMRWLADPHLLSATMIVVIVVFMFCVILYNALSAGQLTGTSGHSELQALSSFPISVFDVAFIRLFLGGLRAIVFVFIFLGTVTVAVAVYHGVISPQVFMSGLSLIIIPILPAVVGAYIALKRESVNLASWLISITQLGFIGYLLASRFPDPPQMAATFVAMVHIPANAVLGRLSLAQFFLFALIWVGLAGVCAWGVHQRVVRSIHPTHTQTQQAMSIVRRVLCKTTDPLTVLVSMSASRLSKFVFFRCLPIFVVVVFVQQTVLAFDWPEWLSMLALALLATLAVILSLALVLQQSFGSVSEHLALQHFPLRWQTIVCAPLLASILVVGLAGASVFIVLPLLTQAHSVIWGFAFFISSIIGGSIVTLVAVLARRSLLSTLLWKAVPIYYMLVKAVLFVLMGFMIRHIPFWGTLIVSITVDLIIAIALWRFAIAYLYKQFLWG